MAGHIFTALTATLVAMGTAGAAPAKEPEVQTNAKGEQLICRKISLTGSRMPRKVCKTLEQWKLSGDTEPRS